jgi:predicted DNA-binding transcriptional regulator YafY
MDRDTESARAVEPYGLLFLGHHLYHAAVAPGENLVKNYRLSRIRGLEVNGARPDTPDYAIPKAFALRHHATGRHAWELGTGDMAEVTVRVTSEAGAALAATRLGEPVEGDPTARRFRVRRLDAFARWILGSGGAVIPLAPPELVTLYQGQAAAALRIYR